MTGEEIQALTRIASPSAAARLEGPHALTAPTPGTSAPSFGAMVSEGLTKLNGDLLATQADMQSLAVGDVQNLHQIMIRMEETRLSFELMLHVRNRLLDAYQDLMKMQV